MIADVNLKLEKGFAVSEGPFVNLTSRTQCIHVSNIYT